MRGYILRIFPAIIAWEASAVAVLFFTTEDHYPISLTSNICSFPELLNKPCQFEFSHLWKHVHFLLVASMKRILRLVCTLPPTLCYMKKEWMIRRKFNYITLKESGDVAWYFLYQYIFEIFVIFFFIYLFVVNVWCFRHKSIVVKVFSSGARIKKGK